MIDNKVMELVTVVAVIMLSIPATIQAYLFYLIYKDVQSDRELFINQPEEQERTNQDVYNPMYAKDSVSLDQFQPHHNRPIKVVREEEDQITPLNGKDN